MDGLILLLDFLADARLRPRSWRVRKRQRVHAKAKQPNLELPRAIQTAIPEATDDQKLSVMARVIALQNMLKANPSLSFHYPGSVEYEGSEQLIRLGLLREDQGWRRIRTAGRDMAEFKDRAMSPAAGWA